MKTAIARDPINPMGSKGPFTVFKGYIDESGDFKRYFTLSCLLGKGSNWGFFQSDWDAVIEQKNRELRQAGRNPISRYKAADCSSRVGEFEDWTVDEQKQLTKKLLSVFAKPSNSLNVISFSMDLQLLPQWVPEAEADPVAFAYALRYIAAGKIPVPEVQRAGGVGFRVWTEEDIERVRQLLPKIANGRKTRWQRQRAQQQMSKGKTKTPKKKK